MLNYYNFLYILLIGAGFPLLRYMSLHFDPNNNNMVRFLTGSAVLLLYGLYHHRSQFALIFRSAGLLVRILLLACLMTANMYLFMQGLAHTNAVTASIFSILAMPLAIIMAALFYIDERQRLKRAEFYLGSLIALGGSFLFVALRHHGGNDGSADFLFGAICLSSAIFIQSIQSLIIKSFKGRLHAVIISFYTALFAGVINLAVSLQTDKIEQLHSVSDGLLLGLAFAGAYGIVTGMMMSFRIIQTQGIAVYNMLQLLVPLSAAFFAYVFLGEQITPGQISGALLVLLGCLWALRVKK